MSSADFFTSADRRERERAERRRRRRARRADAESDAQRLRDTRSGRWLTGAALSLAILTLLGLLALWPHGRAASQSHRLTGSSVAAKVAATRLTGCGGFSARTCRQVVVTVRGQRERITLGPDTPTMPDLTRGERVRVAAVNPAPGQRSLPRGSEHWSFVGVDRGRGLLVLAVALVLIAAAVVRLRGLLAAIGVAASVWLMVAFVVPAILAGRPALLVALVGALAVMFITVLLTNGVSAQSLAAILGISVTLAFACGVAEVGVGLVHLDGRSGELGQYLAQQSSGLSLRGVVLAGMLIGALGVLADTAVTQASAVTALRRADSALDARGLYRGAFSVGRDHLSATIHTLVLAYAGGALPLLLLLRSTNVPAADALSTQDVAEPVTAALVGCLALVAAVPITTGLAALLAARTPAAALGESHHHH